MPSWKVRLVNGSYSRVEDGVVVELFGRTDQGDSITILYRGFRPYFYLVEPPEEVLTELGRDDGVTETTPVRLWINGSERDCVRVTVKYPWTVPNYRSRISGRCQVLAADIPFYQRFMYDFDLGACVIVEGVQTAREGYTTDLVVEASGFSKVRDFKTPMTVLSFDIENSISTGEIYVIGYAFRKRDGEIITGHLEGGEEGSIRDFVRLVGDLDPDIITGYNIDGYDLPHLNERAKKSGISLDLGRDGSPARDGRNHYWRIKGRIVADAWKAVKRELHPKKETLNAVAEMILGERKYDVDPIRIDSLWATDRKRVIDYCIQDALLALKIFERLDVVNKYMDLATVSKLPLDDIFTGRTSTLIDSILVRASDRRGIGVPCTRHHGEEGRIEGGYVHSITAGLYHWVCVLDFKAMYPSVIIANNICFTTISPDGEIVSPIGVRFMSKERKVGLLPEILERLMQDRERFKKLMREATDEEKRRYYEGIQNAIKILMNSFYGVFASSFYRFTNPKIGASITAFARENVKGIIQQLNDEGIQVVYSDTDSIFVLSSEKNLEGAIRFGRHLAERFSKESTVLEFEKVLDPLFSHGAKKRYVAKVIWPKEEMLVRGYETRRTDSFDLQSEALNEIFTLVLEERSKEAVRRAREIIESIRRGEVAVDSLVISRTCMAFSKYQNPDRLAWVQAAKKLMAKGHEFVPGMKVSWIVTDSRSTPQKVEPYIDGVAFTAEPDWEYYAERVAVSLARVTEIFGWDARALLTGHQQSSLFSFAPSVNEDVSAEDQDEAKESVELTLEDFM